MNQVLDPNAHKARAHAKYSASICSRFFACPGSIKLSEGVPERRSAYADEGTAAHELLEDLLTGWKLQSNAIAQLALDKASTETIDAVMIAVEYVQDKVVQHPGAVLLVEQVFEIPSSEAPGEVSGINDVCIYAPEIRKLYVIDYKHGAGVAVEAFGNKQLRYYALGAMCAKAYGWVVESVELVIIQPRAFHSRGPIRSEILTASEIVDFFGELEDAIQAAKAPNAPLVPGDEQCRWCPAKLICPARVQMAVTLAGDNFVDVRDVTPATLPVVEEMTPDRIGHVLAFGDLVIDWIKAVEKRGIELARQGVNIPGRKLVEAVGRRSYVEPETVAAKVAEFTGLPAVNFCEVSPLGVTAMERKIKEVLKPKGKEAVAKGVEQFAFLTTKKSSGNLTLVSDQDSRPAANLTETSFDHIQSVPMVQIEG